MNNNMKTKNHFSKISIKNIVLGICLIVSFFLFAYIVDEVLWEKEGYFDAAVFNFLKDFIKPGFTKIMVAISFLGSAYFMLPAYVVLVILLLFKKERPAAIYTAVIGVTGGVIVYVLKNIFHRQRPVNPLTHASVTYSFPSGHTTSAFILYGLLIYLIWSKNFKTKYKYVISAFLILVALLVAISRIYLRMHFASDVVAGLCIGTIWLSICIWTMNRINIKERQEL